MATTITGKLNKHATVFAAGEFTGFGIRIGVKYYDRDAKADAWTNYQAVIFAKTASQVQFYQQTLIEGAIVEVSADKQRIRQYQGQNGLLVSIELLDAKLGFVSSQSSTSQANAAQPAKPSQQPAPTPQQSMAMQGGYANNAAGVPMPDFTNPANVRAPAAPTIDFDDDIPF